MNALGSYLLQMTCWLAGFWLVYVAFLRKETFFKINRWFLLTGLIASVVMPLLPVNYRVDAPATDFSALSTMLTNSPATEVNAVKSENYWLLLYFLGISVFVLRFLLQILKFSQISKHAENELSGLTKIYRLDIDTAPFSFFRNIYVSKNLNGKAELKAVIAHEKVHIEERHWADLLLLEMVRALQWFNPLLLFYRKAILQNHEYLADTGSLQKGVSARTYKAILANQMLGMPVLKVASGFTLFNPIKRITMMNKNRTKPQKRLKLLWALPIAALIMTAFAKPVYVQASSIKGNKNIQENTITVKGKVIDENGESLQGTTVVVSGTPTGMLTDANGNFEIAGVLPENELVFSFVGYKTVKVKTQKNINVQLEREVMVIKVSDEEVETPLPLSDNSSVSIRSADGNSPLIIVDGKEYNGTINEINSNSIYSIDVLKNESATELYGEKGKNGVVIITRKKNDIENKEEVFVTVEDMPSFKGGDAALKNYLVKATSNTKEKGKATVHFTVMPNGSISNVAVSKASSKALSKEAEKIVKSMPNWKPGKQRSKAVAVDVAIEIEFQ